MVPISSARAAASASSFWPKARIASAVKLVKWLLMDATPGSEFDID
jgi:hypothetical protein